MYFEIENAYYELHRYEWLVDHEGKYVVIREREVLGFYTDYDEAVSAGYKKYGVGETAPFMVKAVCKEDTPIMMLKIGGRRCDVYDWPQLPLKSDLKENEMHELVEHPQGH